MIIIQFPNIKESRVIGARVSLFDNVFQFFVGLSKGCRHVNLRVPNVVALVNGHLSSLKQISYGLTISGYLEASQEPYRNLEVMLKVAE